MSRPDKLDHDDCLDVCWHHRDKVSDEEYRLLSMVAGNWAACLDVTRKELEQSRAIVARVRRGERGEDE
jgi:hypothetical protein